MNLRKYLPFGWGGQENLFDDVREFIYLDELSVRSLLASTGEGGIPVESTTTSMDRSTGGIDASVSGPTGPTSGKAGVNYQSTTQDSDELVSSLQTAQSKFTRLYKSERVKRRLSIEDLTERRESGKLSDHSMGDFDRGNVIELRVKMQPNLLFRLYRVLEYAHNVAPEDLDPDAEQNLSLIRESIGNSIPVVGTLVDYEWTNSARKNIEELSEGEVPNEDLKVNIVTSLGIDSFRGDPIRTLSEEDQFIMFGRIESKNVDTWYPLKITQILDTFPGDAAEEFNEQMKNALKEARKEFKNVNIGSMSGENIEASGGIIEEYSTLLENEIELSVEDPVRNAMIEQSLSQVDARQYSVERELQKALLKEYTQIFSNRLIVGEIEPDLQVELRSHVLRGQIEQRNQTNGGTSDSVSGERPDSFAFKIKPIALYW